MARDHGLEALLADELRDVEGLTQQGMFGGWMWLLHGHLLCGARTEGLLVRLGRDRDGWALATSGVTPMLSGTRRMHGWVRVSPAAAADAQFRRQLLDGALAFGRTLAPRRPGSR